MGSVDSNTVIDMTVGHYGACLFRAVGECSDLVCNLRVHGRVQFLCLGAHAQARYTVVCVCVCVCLSVCL